jgi:hypothetical protein
MLSVFCLAAWHTHFVELHSYFRPKVEFAS